METILRSSLYLAVYRKVLVSVRCYLQIMKVSYLKFFKGPLPEAHAYADDTQLYLSFQQDSAMSEVDVVNALHSCIKYIRTWMISSNETMRRRSLLSLDPEYNQARLILTEVKIGQVRVTMVTSAKNLGTWFDGSLEMTMHRFASRFLYHLHNFRRIRKFLNYDNRKSLVQGVIMSLINYCNSLLFGVLCVYYAGV